MISHWCRGVKKSREHDRDAFGASLLYNAATPTKCRDSSSLITADATAGSREVLKPRSSIKATLPPLNTALSFTSIILVEFRKIFPYFHMHLMRGKHDG